MTHEGFGERRLLGGEGLGTVGLHGWGGGQEFAGVGVLRSKEEVAGGCLLDDTAVLHNSDAVGYLADDGKVVRDEEHGKAVLLAQASKEIEDLGLYGYVEGGGWLVRNEKPGTVHDRHGDEDALSLATGELVRVVLVAVFAFEKANLPHGFEDLGFRSGAGETGVVSVDSLGNLGPDDHRRIEGGHGFLEDHGDLTPAMTAHGVFGQCEQVSFAEANAAGEGG